MREQVIQFANTQYQRIQNNQDLLPRERLTQLSMLLLAYAAVQEFKEYQSVLEDMKSILSSDSISTQDNQSWRLWILSRMAVSSKLMDDTVELDSLEKTLRAELLSNNDKEKYQDATRGWAFAYFASIDESLYENSIAILCQYYFNQKTENTTSNCVWTLVMTLYASACACHREDYGCILQLLKNITGNNSLKDAIRVVPKNDYRQWLVSIIQCSCALMKDTKTLKELQDFQVSKIENFDDMLAKAYELSIPYLLQLEHKCHL
jgi:hypothetical protein